MVKADYPINEFFAEIIKDELNVKNMELIEDAGAFTGYIFKPQLRTVGPKYGKLLGGIKTYLSEVDGSAAMQELNEKEVLEFEVNGETVSLGREDLLIEHTKAEGYETLSDRGITVVLDTALTESLIEEGFVREIISKLQTMRKEAGFEVMDHIRVYCKENDKIKDIIQKNAELIKQDVLAKEMIFDSAAGYEKAWDINKEHVVLAVERL